MSVCRELDFYEAFFFSIINFQKERENAFTIILIVKSRVSVQGVESLWGDCKFIPADWGS